MQWNIFLLCMNKEMFSIQFNFCGSRFSSQCSTKCVSFSGSKVSKNLSYLDYLLLENYYPQRLTQYVFESWMRIWRNIFR